MAPNSSSNKPGKKQYSRMLQPALPLLPAGKGKKAKAADPVLPEESHQIGPELGTPTTTNGVGTHADTQPTTDVPPSDTSQSGSWVDKETSLSTSSRPVTSQATTPALKEVTADLPGSHEDRGEVTKSMEIEQDVGGEETVAVDATYREITEPDSEVAVTEKNKVDSGVAATEENQVGNGVAVPQQNKVDSGVAVPEQNMVDGGVAVPEQSTLDAEIAPAEHVAENGEGAQSLSNRDLSAVGDDGDHQPASEPPTSAPVQPGDQTPTSERTNGLSQTTPSVNTGFNLSRDNSYYGYQRSESSVVHEPTSNGYNQPMVGNPGPMPHIPPRPFGTMPSLQEHFLVLASSKEGTDWTIQVNPAESQAYVIHAHSVILFRSTRLRKLMSRHQSSTYSGRNMINMYPAKYIIPHAFEAALRFAYSDTVLGKDYFDQPHHGPDPQAIRVHNLNYLMSYWASGIELGFEPVKMCAERLLAGYLDWDLLEVTNQYAVELGNSQLTAHPKNATTAEYLAMSHTIIRMVLQFIAAHLDIKNFQLDTISVVTVVPSRLPLGNDGRRSRHNPALASMVFGSMPSSQHMSPTSPEGMMRPMFTYKDTVTSHILVNMDFENLEHFTNMINTQGNVDSARLITAVVAEREARREKVFMSRVSNKERIAKSVVWEKVGLREVVNEGILARERVGFLISTK